MNVACVKMFCRSSFSSSSLILENLHRERVQQSISTVSSLIQRTCLQRDNAAGPTAAVADDIKTRSFVLKNGRYITFVLPLPYVDALLFQLARDENDSLLAPGAVRDDSESSRSAEKRVSFL